MNRLQSLEIGAAPGRESSPRRRGVALLAAVVGAALAAGASAPPSPPSPPSPPESRVVIVTDSRCGAEGARRADHRSCALERVSEGGRLLLFDPARETLYEIGYASDALRLKVLNDLAGFRIVARGRWDDEKRFVALTGAFLSRTPPKSEAVETVD